MRTVRAGRGVDLKDLGDGWVSHITGHPGNQHVLIVPRHSISTSQVDDGQGHGSGEQSKGPPPPQTVQTLITNETAYRIEIPRKSMSDRPLILVPFTARKLDSHEAADLDLGDWEARGLITVNDIQPKSRYQRTPWLNASVFGLSTFVICSAGTIRLGGPRFFAGQAKAPTLPDVYATAAVIALVLTVVTILHYYGHSPRVTELLVRAVTRSFTLSLTIVFGVGLPVLAALGVVATYANSEALPTALQWMVIAVACIAPAAFYFLFTRQRLELLRENFLREVLMLDPAIYTRHEAAAKYGNLLEDVYGTSPSHGYRHGFGMPIIVSTLLLAAGWLLVTLKPPTQPALPPTLREALVFGFLGSYFFAINMCFRRYLRADLNPKAYSQITVRLLLTAMLVTALTVLPFLGDQNPNSNQARFLFLLSFIAGVVPDTALAVLRQSLKRNPATRRVDPGMEEAHPVTMLDGINLYDRSRLLEEGVENVENLAHANLIELMLRTRIPTVRLVDLFDQAILYMHLAEDDGVPRKQWSVLRSCGVRTATDLEAAYVNARERDHQRSRGDHVISPRADKARDRSETEGLINLLGKQNGVPRLQVILDVLADDEWMTSLRYWRRTFGSCKTLTSEREPGGQESVETPVTAG